MGFQNSDEKSHEKSLRADKNTYPINHGAIKKQYSSEQPQQGRRMAPRYAVQTDVLLFSQNKSFRTKSVNLSASGALLQDFLPSEFNQKTFDVVIIWDDGIQKKHISFRGVAIGTLQKSPRIVFTSSGKNSQENLFHILEEFTPIGYAFGESG